MAPVNAIRLRETGGPEKLLWEPVEIGEPGPGETRVRNHAVGLNFIDIYKRSGLYPVDLPATLGEAAAGIVEAIGPDVTLVAVGDRVAHCTVLGAYSALQIVPADRLVPLPQAIDFETAAASLLQGLTAWYLARRTHAIAAGETILIHAAAGGVGLILGQWAKTLGAKTIGTVSTEAKAELARAHGYDHTILSTHENVTQRVRDLTAGVGVPVVYDSVGKVTFDSSLDCLAPRGLLVSFGNASGPVPAFPLSLLATKGSLYVTRPRLDAYVGKRCDLLTGAAELFEMLTSGRIKIHINQRWPLIHAADAHRALEARQTTGSTVLIP